MAEYKMHAPGFIAQLERKLDPAISGTQPIILDRMFVEGLLVCLADLQRAVKYESDVAQQLLEARPKELREAYFEGFGDGQEVPHDKSLDRFENGWKDSVTFNRILFREQNAKHT